MGRRVLAFFLGMIFGIIVFIGAIAGGLYLAAKVITPDTVYPEGDKFLGDFANMTLWDIYSEISKLYKEKLGVTDENGMYYTLGEFLEKYNIDPVTAFGKPLSKDILEIPIFEFFGGSADDAKQQIRASVLFSLVNFVTQKTDEDGNVTGGYFGQRALDKLYEHSITDLMDETKGFAYVFDNVLLADLFESNFPAEEPTDGDKLLWAFGQASVGRLMSGMDGNMMLQFKKGGAFETLGSLTMTELLGRASEYIEIIFGDEIFASLIDDNGNLLIDPMMENLYLGKLLSFERMEIAAEVAGEYTELLTDPDNGSTVLYKTEDGTTTYAITEGEKTYFARINCNDEEHEHSADCFEFVWYDFSAEADDHEHSEDCYTPEHEASGMYGKMANKRVKDLGNISDILKTFTLKDVLENDVPESLKSIENKPVGEIGTAINNMYLGDFLRYTKKPVNVANGFDTVDNIEGIMSNGEVIAKKNDEGKWYDAILNCAENHDHDYDCYDYNWYNLKCVNKENHKSEEDHVDDCYVYEESLIGRIARLKMSELSGDHIKNVVNDTPLGEVIDISHANGLLKELADVKIGEMSHELDALYVGIAMGYHRNEIVDYFGESDAIANDTRTDNAIYKEGEKLYFFDAKHNKYYEAQLMCLNEDHTSESDHLFSCYGFVWYNCNHDTDVAHDTTYIVKGLNGKMSNLRLDELGTEIGMSRISASLTIGDLIDSGMMTLNEEDEYKLDIIFDNCGNDRCNLAAYMIAHQNSGTSAEDYYKSIHSADETHRGVWMDMKLSVFITSLLGAM